MSGEVRGGAERDQARKVARRLLAARLRLCAVGAVASAVVLVLVLALPFDYPAWVLLVPVALALTVAGWLLVNLFPRRKVEDEPGLAANVVDEPELHAWMAGLAHDLGVHPPDSIRLAPSTGAWVTDLSGSPTLVVGTGWLTWLHIDELNRLCALEMSMLRIRDEPRVAEAVKFAGNLDVDALVQSKLPVVGRVIRRIGARFEQDRDALFDACLSWSAASIPAKLRPTEAEVGEGRLADEGWQVLSERWLAPVKELGRGMESLAFPHRELLSACQESDLLEREWQRPSGPPAMNLLSDPVTIDGEVATWLAHQGPEPDAPVLSWDEYIEQVTLPTWRTSVADVVTAASRVRGSAGAMTLGTLLEAVESGSGLAIGELLVCGEVTPENVVNAKAARRAYDDALGTAFTHAISLALVETGLATPVVDVLWGVVLESLDSETIPVETHVKAYCRNEDWAGLRWYVESLDLDANLRLRFAGVFGDAEAEVGSDLIAWRHGRVHDIVFSDGCLRAYPRSIWRKLRTTFEKLTGLAPPRDEFLGEPLDDRRVKPAMSVAVVEVDQAELFRRPHGLAWTLRLDTADETFTFTGIGDGAHVAPLLQSAFRGRMKVTGLGVRPSRFMRVLGKTGWYVICGGILVLMSGVLGYALGSGDADQGRQTESTIEAVFTFGVLGATLIALGMIPYQFVARRGHRLA